MQEIEGRGRVYASEVRERSEEILGKKTYKAWESFAARLRKKLRLKSETNELNVKPFWSKI